MDIIILSLNS